MCKCCITFFTQKEPILEGATVCESAAYAIGKREREREREKGEEKRKKTKQKQPTKMVQFIWTLSIIFLFASPSQGMFVTASSQERRKDFVVVRL